MQTTQYNQPALPPKPIKRARKLPGHARYAKELAELISLMPHRQASDLLVDSFFKRVDWHLHVSSSSRRLSSLGRSHASLSRSYTSPCSRKSTSRPGIASQRIKPTKSRPPGSGPTSWCVLPHPSDDMGPNASRRSSRSDCTIFQHRCRRSIKPTLSITRPNGEISRRRHSRWPTGVVVRKLVRSRRF